MGNVHKTKKEQNTDPASHHFIKLETRTGVTYMTVICVDEKPADTYKSKCTESKDVFSVYYNNPVEKQMMETTGELHHFSNGIDYFVCNGCFYHPPKTRPHNKTIAGVKNSTPNTSTVSTSTSGGDMLLRSDTVDIEAL